MVTGAAGDFDSCIVPEILGRGHEVIGLSRRPHSRRSPRNRHVPADIGDTDAPAAPITFGMKDASNTMQFVHPDDLGRFFADGLRLPNTVPVVFDGGTSP
ncbi:MAG: hypothetical protein ACRDTK_05885 [Mycobacterium sp.]